MHSDLPQAKGSGHPISLPMATNKKKLAKNTAVASGVSGFLWASTSSSSTSSFRIAVRAAAGGQDRDSSLNEAIERG
jgi:hypothetical protein